MRGEVMSLTAVLCVLWAATLLYGEMFAFWWPSLSSSCSWPRPHPSTTAGVGYEPEYIKIAVLADPQIMDRTSHGLAPKSLALEILQFYTDLFMRRAFLASIMPFEPDVVLFLGDYFDGGPILSNEEWQESLSRFKHIFYLNTHGRNKNVKVYYLPGNHDIGYASLHSRKPEVVRRYEKVFGERNYQFVAGKVQFIAIDAQSIDGHSKSLASASRDFVKNVSTDDTLYPRVLLTHIPLYRLDWTTCGPNRYSSIINQRISLADRDREIVYQNYITREGSDFLLESIRPVLVLSAHDHDQCTIVHTSKYGPVMEHTVGTISWQQGNLYPSFMLLTANNNPAFLNASRPEDAISTHLCFLPMQTHIYVWYLCFYVLTLLATIFWPTNSMGLLHHYGNFMGNARKLISHNLFKSGTKEKDEDEICEYEMIWDAEGSMHLVKKTSKAPISNDKVLSERGNAVMRTAARKQFNEEIDSSVTVDMNAEAGLDTGGRLPPKFIKSRTKMVIQRLLRAFQMLTVIAMVNLPLYIMLIFKDWIGVPK